MTHTLTVGELLVRTCEGVEIVVDGAHYYVRDFDRMQPIDSDAYWPPLPAADVEVEIAPGQLFACDEDLCGDRVVDVLEWIEDEAAWCSKCYIRWMEEEAAAGGTL